MKLDLSVPNLACSACVEAVTKAVHTVDATAQVAADPKTKQVSVVSNAAEADIKNAITTAGYTVA
ncbi:heavy-metal-associated domain-containing protein [Nodosilinea sp. LEGE 07088]|uniref:heavy-metal-associated domain-containing protein n=1 Tax=Nodosilinea sp. LEGE 07088 TaxID=2777968 RepID=UPI0018817D2B|nr:heavy-metal-associated domain-containing protein [Nodosilinea sp. LEGE 07088]MBE9135671.1 heavy-metal-associated domain-containing protein [Nodosilinea sp. LEGE 07088]